MDANDIAKLEQLSRLRASGALSDDEFAAAKAALLSDAPAIAGENERIETAAVPPVPDVTALSPIWQLRFRYLAEQERSGAAVGNATLGAMPWLERMRVNFSTLGFLFGPFYLLYLGLWRAALSITGGAILLSILIDALGFGDDINRAFAAGVGGLIATTCIPLYYLKVTRGVNAWNPFGWWIEMRRGKSSDAV